MRSYFDVIFIDQSFFSRPLFKIANFDTKKYMKTTFLHDRMYCNFAQGNLAIMNMQNLQTWDRHFNNENTFVRTTEVKLCILITKITLYFPFHTC